MEKILVVDDVAQNRELLRALLAGSGYAVAMAANGAEALAMARGDPPDLAVTDTLMPVMDGFRMCREWMRDERLRHIPLVFYSATYRDPDDRELALGMGAARYIIKPAEPPALLAQLREVLADHRAGRLPQPARTLPDERSFLAQYDAALVRKLEHKLDVLDREIERRRQTEEALRESEARLRHVIDGLGPHNFVGLLSVDGLVLEANQSALAAARLKREDVVGKPVEDTYWWSYSEPVRRQLREAVRKAAAGDPSRYDVEIRIAPDIHIWIDFSVQPLRDAAGRVEFLVPSAVVIQERKQAELALHENRERIAGILDSAMDAIISVDESQRIIMFNPAAEKMFGRRAADMIGGPLDALIPAESRTHHAEHIRRFGATGVSNRAMGGLGAVSGVRADGTVFPVEAAISQTGAAGRKTYTVILRDITERRRAEAEMRRLLSDAERGRAALLSVLEDERQAQNALRELSQRLIEVQEEERRALARELHDRVGQALSALNLSLGLARARLPGDVKETIGAQLDDAQGLVVAITRDVRNVMSELRPPALDDYGLVAALRNLGKEFSDRTQIAVSVDGRDLDPRPSSALETACYRIAQEAFTNIAKHARARKVAVAVSAHAGEIEMEIADDGAGMAAGRAASEAPTWGMATMRERAEAVGGTFSVESTAGAGTKVIVRVPRGRGAKTSAEC